MNAEELLHQIYAAFNARDIDTALAAMRQDVEWPNGMEGGVVHGHDDIRSYWTRQWSQVDSKVELLGIQRKPDGMLAVEARTVVKDLQGAVLADRVVVHLYRFESGLIAAMEIHEVGEA